MALVLKGGTLLDGTGSAPVPDSVIVVTDGRFTYVGNGDGLEVNPADEVIDLKGRTVLPGLIDSHDHQQFLRSHGPIPELWATGAAYLTLRSVGAAMRTLREGVTTVREMGAIGGTNLMMRLVTERGMILGPRIQTCGQPITMTGGHAYQICVEADGVDGVRKAARQVLKDGVDFVKIMTSSEGPNRAIQALKAAGKPLSMPQYTEEEIRAAVEEAHAAGKKAVAHACEDVSIRRCIDAGIDCIEHANYMNRENADLMAERGIFLVPTLAVHYESRDLTWERGKLKAENMKYLFEALMKSYGIAVQAGVPLAVGTDALGDITLEMQLMIEGGLSNMDVLVAATRGGAQVLDMEDQIGSVKVGKLADVTVLRRDPLADILAVRDVEIVIKQGQLYRPETFPDLPPYDLDRARQATINYGGYRESLNVHNV